MTKEKKEFKWDSEVKVGEYGNEKERHTVNICTLNGKTYVQDMKEVYTQKNGWKRTKGNTMTLENFKELQNLVGAWELGSSFDGSEEVQVETKSTGLKAKHQAKGSAPALKGAKSSIREKLEKNENFGSLSKAKQDKAVKEAESLHKEYGMVSIGMSKTDTFAVWGKGQLEAEKEIKKTKGFARAKITFLA